MIAITGLARGRAGLEPSAPGRLEGKLVAFWHLTDERTMG